MNLAALERKLNEMTDLAAIADMSPEGRALKLAETRAMVERLEKELTQAIEKAKQLFDERQGKQREKGFDYPGWRQDMRTELEATEASGKLMRQYRAAQKSLDRFTHAIAQAEQADLAEQPQANIDYTSRPNQGERKKRKRT